MEISMIVKIRLIAATEARGKRHDTSLAPAAGLSKQMPLPVLDSQNRLR